MDYRPPWDGRVYDVAKVNSRLPSGTRKYFSRPQFNSRETWDPWNNPGTPVRRRRAGSSSASSEAGYPVFQRQPFLCWKCGASVSCVEPTPAKPENGRAMGATVAAEPETQERELCRRPPSKDVRRAIQKAEIQSALARSGLSASTARRLRARLQKMEAEGGKKASPRGRAVERGADDNGIGHEPSTPPRKQPEEGFNEDSTPDEKPVKEKASAKGKGKGKGKAAPPPPPQQIKKAKPEAKCGVLSTPLFGRRINWQAFTKSRVVGTIFEDLGHEADVDITRLQHLCAKQEARLFAAQQPRWITLLDRERAQSILIALKRQPLTFQIVDSLSRLNFDDPALTIQICEVLSNAAPTTDECAKLLGFTGEIAQLRDAEQMVLPLARLTRPSAQQRLSLVLFNRGMLSEVQATTQGLCSFKRALASMSSSSALRAVLRHVRRLGNVLNHGIMRSTDDVVHGFALDVLPRLAQTRCTAKPIKGIRITLMHILVAQLSAEDPCLPREAVDELADVHIALRSPLKELADRVIAFEQSVQRVTTCLADVLCPCCRSASSSADDIKNESHDSSRSPRCQCDEDSAIIGLKTLAQRAVAHASAMKADLSAVRTAATSTLSLFGEAVSQPHEADAKALELIRIVVEFRDVFEPCMWHADANPRLAKACHSQALPFSKGRETIVQLTHRIVARCLQRRHLPVMAEVIGHASVTQIQ